MKIALDSEDGMPLEAESDEFPAQKAFVYNGPSSESSAAAQARVQDVILGALRQTLPRDRELSAWEPQKLHARHISMVCDRAAGLLPREIAAKYKMHQVYVNVILTHPDSLQILAALQALNADKLMDVNARLQGYANEMLTGQVEVFRTTQDKRLKVRIAQDVLDRAGYGPRQKIDINAAHRFVLPSAAAMGIASALQEDQRVADIDYSQYTGQRDLVPALESGADLRSQPRSEQPETVASASPDASSELPEQLRRTA
jgi:hypothetical protein